MNAPAAFPPDAPGPKPSDPPVPIERDALPGSLAAELYDDEHVLYWAVPIRRAGGRWVYAITFGGLCFVPAAIGAINETIGRGLVAEFSFGTALGIVLLAAGELLFLGFSMMMLVWPLLSERHRRQTIVAITDQRVLRLGLRKGREPRRYIWPVSSCDAPQITHQRGASATLVLTEHMRERKSDGRMVYEWQKLPGLPRAQEALVALIFARRQATLRMQLEQEGA